jgi:flagellar biosynthesis chaperone FliJ
VSPRQKRIEKVVAHRGKVLDQRITELSQHKREEEAARLRAEQERAQLQLASETRLKLAEAPLSAADWVAANEWLKSRAAYTDLAETHAVKARLGTQRARAHVLHARTDLKKVEVLSERIGSEERTQRERLERRLEDELTAQRMLNDPRGDKQ